MALQSSGAISLNDIATEFGGSTPHSLSEYYGVADGIPSSGTISMSQFYGATAQTTHSITGNGANLFGSTASIQLDRDESSGAIYYITPGIPVSSSMTFALENGGQKTCYVYINWGESDQTLNNGGDNSTVSFSGTVNNLYFIVSTTDESGDSVYYGVSAIDGAQNWTVVNSSTLTIP